jgi:glycosyltransferase involved in cell wall biosynthesis
MSSFGRRRAGPEADLDGPGSVFLQLPGIRVACLPPYDGGRQNAYLRLCYEHLAEHGVVVVPHAQFTLRWLWRRRRDVTFLHFQWQPDWYYLVKRRFYRDPAPRLPRTRSWLKLAGFRFRLRAARLFGYRIVWTIHEVQPPLTVLRPRSLGRIFDRLGQRLLARRSDLLIAHHDSLADTTARELRIDRERIRVIPHGPYTDVYPPGRPRAAVRAELGIDPDTFVFLAFGTVRPDKSIAALLEAFRALPDTKVALVVAGRVEDFESLRALREAAHADRRIKLLLGFVSDEQVSELFGASDAAVLARAEDWTSGSLILSLSLGVPVVTARLPAHEDLLDPRAGWLFEPDDASSLGAALADAAASTTWQLNARRLAAAAAGAALPTWYEIGERLALHMLDAVGSEERIEELAMRTWPLLDSRSVVAPVFPVPRGTTLVRRGDDEHELAAEPGALSQAAAPARGA